LSPPGSELAGTTRNAAEAGGVLDALARRGPSRSGVRTNSEDGGRSPFAFATITTAPVDTDQATVTGAFGWKPVPVTVTMVPGGPTVGVSTRCGTREPGWPVGLVGGTDPCDVGVVAVVAVVVVGPFAGGVADTVTVPPACRLPSQ
jgi:hypothetical protein